MTFTECYERVKNKFMEKDLSSLNRDMSAMLHLTGSGDIFLAYVDGCKLIEPVNHRGVDFSVTTTIDVFERLINHQLDPVIGFSTGQLRMSGNMMLAMSLLRTLR